MSDVQAYPDMVTPDYDPFRGALPRGGSNTDPSFPLARLRQVDLTEAQIDKLRLMVEGADVADAALFATFARQADDESVRKAALEILRSDYDTSDKNIDQVNEDLEKDPELLPHALRAEQARGAKARKTLIAELEDRMTAANENTANTELTPKDLEQGREADALAANQTGDSEAHEVPPVVDLPDGASPPDVASTDDGVNDTPDPADEGEPESPSHE